MTGWRRIAVVEWIPANRRFETFMQAGTKDSNSNEMSDWTAPVRGAGQCLRAFSSEVDAGSREENAQKQESRAPI
jgi:hypothetical protein